MNSLVYNNLDLSEVMIQYISALKVLETELEILSDEFELTHKYNPVEHIKTRIKTFDSIAFKLERKGYEVTINNIINHVYDVVGVRIVCSFVNDIYSLVEVIEKSHNIEIVERKDYIKNPKKSGYSSYHLIVLVKVGLSSGVKYVKAEIQIRTMGMDFWASLEHKIKYKFPNDIPVEVSNELISSADDVRKLDYKMASLNKKVEDYQEKGSF